MSIVSDNKAKYLKPPTIEEIDTFRKSLGVSIAQFERFYGLYKGAIKKIRKGKINLPASKWHIIFEKIVPAYGAGFLNGSKSNIKSGAKPRGKKYIPKASSAVLEKLGALK